MKIFRHIIFLLFAINTISCSSSIGEEENILNRHSEILLKRYIHNSAKVTDIIANFDPVSRKWTNIDYTNDQRADWHITTHMSNINTLALHYTDNESEWYQNEELYQIIISGLDDWAENRYHNQNWWNNEIGIPRILRDILVLMRNYLPEDNMENYLPIMNQFRIDKDGANLVWSADLGLYYGLFTNNFQLVDSAVQCITREIKICDSDGLKPDYSFHQHGARLQMYHYGGSFLKETIRIAWELQDSRWAFPQEKIEMLSKMLLEGWQWMSRGIYTIPETIDRAATRIGQLNSTADIRSHIDFFIALDPSNEKAYKALAARQEERGDPWIGFRFFPYSDIAVHHTPHFSFFHKSISTRTLPAESINSENLKGRLMNSGTTYFIQDGDEYFNLMPVWDWDKLPGITAFEGADHLIQLPYNGSVSDGALGLTSMDYLITDKTETKQISAKKTWIASGDYIICLIADINFKHVNEGYTTMDQSRLRNKVETNKGALSRGSYQLKNTNWIRHHNFVYAPLEHNNIIELYADTVSGDWHKINQSIKSMTVSDQVFKASMLHKIGDRTASYLIGFAGEKSSDSLLYTQPFTIIKNDAEIQAVMINRQSIAVSFHSSGKLVTSSHNITVDRPCLVLIKPGEIYVSDPLHVGGKITLIYNDQIYPLELPNDGSILAEKLKK